MTDLPLASLDRQATDLGFGRRGAARRTESRTDHTARQVTAPSVETAQAIRAWRSRWRSRGRW
jgi:hypothetical protein